MLVTAVTLTAQGPAQTDWTKVDEETMQHFQALLRFDTSDPPGGEKPAADYLKQVLDKAGIPAQLVVLEANRPNVVARLKGNGSKRPLLLMAHTDVVNVDPKKWTHPPFSATRQGGYVYSRGTVDDKDNVVSTLMTLLMLKRNNVPLDRDVIALFEAGEEGTTRVGIQFMANQHFGLIDAEYCLAEGGGGTREGGQMKFVSVQTLEKIPRAHHADRARRRRTRLGAAADQFGRAPGRRRRQGRASGSRRFVPTRRPPPTSSGWRRSRRPSRPSVIATRLSPDPKVSGAADEFLRANEPRHASMLRTSISPNMFQAGYRVNVIPSEATATLDVRMLPDEDPAAFLEEVRRVVNDPSVEVNYTARDVRPGGTTRLNTEAFAAIEANVTKHYKTITLPTMSTGATDMAYLRAKGIQCYGIGPATRHRGRTEGLRRAQRPGTDSRKRAVPLRPLQLRPRADLVRTK